MPTKPPPTMAEVRAWARDKGMAVNPAGNLSTTVVDAFNKGRPPHRRFERAVRREPLQTR